MQMPVNFQLRTIERESEREQERAPAVMHFPKRRAKHRRGQNLP